MKYLLQTNCAILLFILAVFINTEGKEQLDSTITISGNITAGTAGLADVNMTGLDVLTDSNGFYSVTVTSGFSGIILPTKYGYTFDPNSISYTNITSDQINQDYNALPSDDFNDNRRSSMWRHRPTPR